MFISLYAQENNDLAYFEYVPEKWRSEVINFPLDFAPSLGYRGKLELLFSPGMFNDKSEEFLSYGFIWAIEGKDIPTTKQLEQALKAYYYGLQSVVSENTLEAEVDSKIWLSDNSTSDFLSYDGVIGWTEPFVTQSSQSLHLRVTFKVSEESNQWVGFFRVSPQKADHPIWKVLDVLPVNKHWYKPS
jgi:hypothetical protein